MVRLSARRSSGGTPDIGFEGHLENTGDDEWAVALSARFRANGLKIANIRSYMIPWMRLRREQCE